MKRKMLVGCTLIAIMAVALLSGCSHGNSVFADDGIHHVMNPLAFEEHIVSENYLAYEHKDTAMFSSTSAEWLGGSIIVEGREYRAWEVWEYLVEGSGSSSFNVSDIENAVSMKHLKLDDRYLLWWFDEQGREVGIGDVARIGDENALVVDSDNDVILSSLESSRFFAVRFLPEQVYNPDNIFSFRAVSLESLKSMYRDLNEQFDYALMIPLGLSHVGYFNGDVRFVELPT